MKFDNLKDIQELLEKTASTEDRLQANLMLIGQQGENLKRVTALLEQFLREVGVKRDGS